jgi:TPR repeat protein
MLRVARIYEEACERGDPPSCSHAGVILDNRNDPHGLELNIKACERGFVHACFYAGLVYRQGGTIPQSFRSAAEFFTKGCDGRDADACMELANAYALGQGVKKDRKRAHQIAKLAEAYGYRGE